MPLRSPKLTLPYFRSACVAAFASPGDDEEKGVNTMRGKIVRPDFIQNINEGEHWIKGEMVKNQVRPDLWVELS